MLLLITVMCVIAEKKLQLNSASLYVVVIFIIGGILIGGARAPWPPPGYAYAVQHSTRITLSLMQVIISAFREYCCARYK